MNKEEVIAKSDFIFTIGTMLADNKEPIRNKIIESIAKTDAYFIYAHPIDNFDVELYYNQFIKYEVGSEEGIFAMMLNTFVKDASKEIVEYIDNLDIGYISAESSVGEEEFEEAYEISFDLEYKTLIIGDDLIEHAKLENILKFLNILKKYTDFHIIILNDNLEEKFNNSQDFDLDEVGELKSYNGTLVYKLVEDISSEYLQVSETFANIAKVLNNDEVFINTENERIKKIIKIDDKLKGTIGVIIANENEKVFSGYRYKKVIIEK